MKRICKRWLLLLSVPIYLSCSNSDIEVPMQAESLTIELNAQQRSIRDMGNDFANNLLIHASEEDKNVLLSPISLQFILGMTANGTNEKAYDELVNVLGLSDYSLEELNDYHQTMIAGLSEKVENVDFSLGNAIWVQDGFSVKDLFIANMKDYYDASINNIDFTNTEDAQVKIDEWAYKTTNSTIKNLQLPLTASTKLVLNNACFFKGKWSSPFDEKNTQQRSFYGEGGDVASVQFMQSKKSMSYLQGDGYEQIFMSFEGGFSMSFVLPQKGCNLEDILPEVNWIAPKNLREVTVDLKLPKFKMELIRNLNLVLQEMGIKEIYNSGSLPNLANDLAVSLIQQNISIGIDESGVKASATTSGTIHPSANVSSVVSFDLNRPFAFAIRENSSKTLLFIGKVANFK